VWGLAVSQTVSWGILYYAFAVLLVPMQRDLGWSRSVLVGGFTLAIVISGILAPAVGRRLDSGGPRQVMVGGSVIATAMVVAWSRVGTPVAYYLAWAGIGIAMALVLYEPAFTVLAKRCAPRARRAITTVTLVAGLASFVFQPLTSTLASGYGWRTTLLVLAAVVGVVTIPIHATVLVSGEVSPGAPRPRRRSNERPAEVNDGRFWLITSAFAGAAVASYATAVLLVAFLADHGWSLGRAALAAGILGAMQLPGRLLFGPLTERFSAAHLASALLAAPAVGILTLLASGGGTWVWPAVSALGLAQGTTTLLRATLFVDLYGTERIGALNGLSATWVILARALGPLGASVLISWTGGYGPTFAVLAALAGASAAGMHRALRQAAVRAPRPGR
jgi:MFS family permease